MNGSRVGLPSAEFIHKRHMCSSQWILARSLHRLSGAASKSVIALGFPRQVFHSLRNDPKTPGSCASLSHVPSVCTLSKLRTGETGRLSHEFQNFKRSPQFEFSEADANFTFRTNCLMGVVVINCVPVVLRPLLVLTAAVAEAALPGQESGK